jgi:serine/threonine protein kinase
MNEMECPGCGGLMDLTGIPAFTKCECFVCQADIIIPMELDFLLLEKPLGRKANFEIFEGFDQAYDLKSIIFILDSGMPDYEFYCNLAKEEEAIISTFTHKTACPMVNHGFLKNDTFFLTMPTMDGCNLKKLTSETDGNMDIERVLELMREVAICLAQAHHKEIIHHDICLDNIHIDARGIVRVNNFYISSFNYKADQHKTPDKLSVSQYTISPEKAKSGIEDKRGDVFSFGVVFYYLLTGSYPFNEQNELETVFSRVRVPENKKADVYKEVFSEDQHRYTKPESIPYKAPTPINELRDNVPVEICDAVHEMLRPLPKGRPQFSEIVTFIDTFNAKKDQMVIKAQQEMVMTKTRPIPAMESLANTKINKLMKLLGK